MKFRLVFLMLATIWATIPKLLATQQPQPNIILVMCDDLGWGDPQCFDPNSPIRTPYIDAMASAGLKFNRFYAAAPVCSPTRGSCLTGRHPYRYGIYSANRGHLKPDEITLPEILQKQGYVTGHFGKWHLGTLTTEIEDANRGGPRGAKNFSPPSMHGYDDCLVTESKVPTYDPMLKPKDADKHSWDYLSNKSKAEDYGTRYWDIDGNIVEDNLAGDDSRIIMDRAIPFIRSATESAKPFFAAIWFHAPHLPVVAGPDDVKPYASYDIYKRNYYGCISAIDKQVGRLRKVLEDFDASDDTMLWFCSDNGPEGNDTAPGSASGLRGRKRSLYEGGVRVPGILHWPAVVKPGETDFPCVTSDYLPTVLDALGLPMPDNRPFDGVSLMPLLRGQMKKRTTKIGFQSGNVKTLVGQRFKLLITNKKLELYDLIADRSEARDIAREHPDVVASMKNELNTWVASCKASDAGSDYVRSKTK